MIVTVRAADRHSNMTTSGHSVVSLWLYTEISEIFDDTDNSFFARIPYLKTVSMFCRHSYLIILF